MSNDKPAVAFSTWVKSLNSSTPHKELTNSILMKSLVHPSWTLVLNQVLFRTNTNLLNLWTFIMSEVLQSVKKDDGARQLPQYQAIINRANNLKLSVKTKQFVAHSIIKHNVAKVSPLQLLALFWGGMLYGGKLLQKYELNNHNDALCNTKNAAEYKKFIMQFGINNSPDSSLEEATQAVASILNDVSPLIKELLFKDTMKLCAIASTFLLLTCAPLSLSLPILCCAALMPAYIYSKPSSNLKPDACPFGFS